MFVYVAAAESGLVKIGVSANPERRLVQLKVDRREPVHLRYVAEVPCERARDVERGVLGRLHASRVCGEWFRLDEDHAISALEDVIVDIVGHERPAWHSNLLRRMVETRHGRLIRSVAAFDACLQDAVTDVSFPVLLRLFERVQDEMATFVAARERLRRGTVGQ